MSACKACGADMVWAVTLKGKRMPLDMKPDPDGMFVLVDGIARLPELGEEDLERFTSHFATCAFADDFRRKSAPKRPDSG